MKSVAAEGLKRRCSSMIDEIYKTGEEVIITKDGEPVAMLVSCREQPDKIFPSAPRRKKEH